MRVSAKCYAITGLGYSPPWCVNAGFVAGERITLVVDTGGNAHAGRTVHGYASAVKPANRMLVVNTEKHFDHIGGNCVFRDLGIEVWGHREATRTGQEFEAEIAEFNSSIPDPLRRARFEAEAFFKGTRLALPNRELTGGMSFDLGGCVAEILATPGHTRSNMSVWIRADRVLYTGDCLVSDYGPNLAAGAPADWKVWLASLRAIEELRPEVIVPGHGTVATGHQVQAAIESVRATLEGAIVNGAAPAP